MAKRAKANGHGKVGHNRLGGTLRLYRKVITHGHDPDMDDVVSVIAREGLTAGQAATLSGVGTQTISNWEKRKTKRPQHLTMKAVLAGIGHSFSIKRVEKINYQTELPKAQRWIERRETERNQQKG